MPNDDAHPPLEPVSGEVVATPKEMAIMEEVDGGEGLGRVLITPKMIEATKPKRDAFSHPVVPDHALTHALRGAEVTQHGGLTVVDYRKATAPPPSELLPCPFCGGTEGAFGTDSLDMEWESRDGSHDGLPLWWWVACDCGARGPSVEASIDGARAAWNRRAALLLTDPSARNP